jgi:glycosyltransferase involved in cell wall biosynthesis
VYEPRQLDVMLPAATRADCQGNRLMCLTWQQRPLTQQGPPKINAVYCTDSQFMQSEGGQVYAEGQFSYAFWQRYLHIFASLTVVGRGHALGQGRSTAGLNISSGIGVSFIFVPDLASPTRLIRHHAKAASILSASIAQADAVIVRLPSLIGFLGARIAERLAKTWVAEVAACPWDQLWNYGTLQGKVYAPVHAYRMRRAVARSPFTLYVTREFLQRRYPARGFTAAVSNVDVACPEPAVLEGRLLRILSSKRLLKIGLIGSIKHKYKGLGTAIEGLARVKDRLPEFEFRVLGQGNPRPWQRDAERHGLGDRLRFDGVLQSGQPVLDWLDRIDIYVQPSFQEGLPRALVEAMSRACPAIASTAGGIPELLPPDCLHPPGDAASFGKLILKAACDPAWQARQACRNFETAREYAREALDEQRTRFLRRVAAHVFGGTKSAA